MMRSALAKAACRLLVKKTPIRPRQHYRLQLEMLEARNLLTITASPLAALMPGDTPGTMMLLPSGTVMIQGGGVTNRWHSFSPDSTGSYINGTWGTISSMNLQRLYFGSVVLPTDQVLVLGGEYSGASGSQNTTPTGEIYSMATNTWSNITNFPHTAFGDDPLTVLAAGPNAGDVLGGYIFGPQTYSYSVSGNNWTQRGTKLANDRSDEEGWVQLPGGKILSYNVFASPGVNLASSSNPASAQVYDPVSDTWTATGPVPVGLSSPSVPGDSGFFELGPGVLLPPTTAHPQGLVFFIGGTGPFTGTTYTAGAPTALYDPISNSWTAGPSIPLTGYGADDAPAAVLPDGNVIFTADTAAFHAPTMMFEYNSTLGTITDITSTLPTALRGQLNSSASFVDRMVVLPSGQVLFSDASQQLWTLSETGAINSTWRPKIMGISPGAVGQFALTGQQLNGMDEGASYGDDVEMSSNYPIVRLISTSTGTVYYATTSNWSNQGVQTGTMTVTTTFTLPPSLSNPGTYVVTVIANGIPSTPVTLFIDSGQLNSGGTGSPSSLGGDSGSSGTSGGDSGSPSSVDGQSGLQLPDIHLVQILGGKQGSGSSSTVSGSFTNGTQTGKFSTRGSSSFDDALMSVGNPTSHQTTLSTPTFGNVGSHALDPAVLDDLFTNVFEKSPLSYC
jgi:hypothetical protein